MTSSISPVAVFPSTATTLSINPAWSVVAGSTPIFSWTLADSGNNPLLSGTNAMTSDQWNNWGAGEDDAAYILSCVAANLGLTLTS